MQCKVRIFALLLVAFLVFPYTAHASQDSALLEYYEELRLEIKKAVLAQDIPQQSFLSEHERQKYRLLILDMYCLDGDRFPSILPAQYICETAEEYNYHKLIQYIVFDIVTSSKIPGEEFMQADVRAAAMKHAMLRFNVTETDRHTFHITYTLAHVLDENDPFYKRSGRTSPVVTAQPYSPRYASDSDLSEYTNVPKPDETKTPSITPAPTQSTNVQAISQEKILLLVILVIVIAFSVFGICMLSKVVSLTKSVSYKEAATISHQIHYCHKCGALIPIGSSFCNHCGQPIPNKKDKQK